MDLHSHAFGILALGVWFIAPLVLRNLLLRAEPVAIPRGVVPAHPIDGRVFAWAKLLSMLKIWQAFLELRYGDQLRRHGEGIVDLHLATTFTIGLAWFIPGRADREFARGRDHGEGLTLTVDVPARLV